MTTTNQHKRRHKIYLIDTSGSTRGFFVDDVAREYIRAQCDQTSYPTYAGGYNFDEKEHHVFGPKIFENDSELFEKLSSLLKEPDHFTKIVVSVLGAVSHYVSRLDPTTSEEGDITICVHLLTDMQECYSYDDPDTIISPRDIPKAITDGLVKLGEENPVFNSVAVSISAVFYSDNDNADAGQHVYEGCNGLPPIFKVIGSINKNMSSAQRIAKIKETLCSPRQPSIRVRDLSGYKLDPKSTPIHSTRRVVGSVVKVDNKAPQYIHPAHKLGKKAFDPPPDPIKRALNSVFSSLCGGSAPLLRKATSADKEDVRAQMESATGKGQASSLVLYVLNRHHTSAPTLADVLEDSTPAVVKAFLKFTCSSDRYEKDREEHSTQEAKDKSTLALMKTVYSQSSAISDYEQMEKSFNSVMQMSQKTVKEWYDDAPRSPRKKRKSRPSEVQGSPTSPKRSRNTVHGSPRSPVSRCRPLMATEDEGESEPKSKRCRNLILSEEFCLDEELSSDDDEAKHSTDIAVPSTEKDEFCRSLLPRYMSAKKSRL